MPPGRPAHEFGYTAINLEEKYPYGKPRVELREDGCGQKRGQATFFRRESVAKHVTSMS